MVVDCNGFIQRMAGKVEERADGAGMTGMDFGKLISKDWIFFHGRPAEVGNNNSLIMLLSEQKAADIKSPGKREEIRQVATANVKRLITDLSGEGEVAEVLFSNILVQ